MPFNWRSLLRYLWPGSVFSGVMNIIKEWRHCDVKTKAMLAVFFIPAILSVVGLVASIARFVLFVLPAFVMTLLGWLLLILLFGGGGLFCYEKMSGKRVTNNSTSFYDVTPNSSDGETGDTKQDWFGDKKNWFDDVKRWTRK